MARHEIIISKETLDVKAFAEAVGAKCGMHAIQAWACTAPTRQTANGRSIARGFTSEPKTTYCPLVSCHENRYQEILFWGIALARRL